MLRRDCRRHRAVLFEVAGGLREASREPAALSHLSGCPACRRDVESVALVVCAVRRSAAGASGAEPSPDAWPRLRRRLRRRGQPVRWFASALAGLALGAGLAVALVVPVRMGATRPANEVLGESGYRPAMTQWGPAMTQWGPAELADRQWLRDNLLQRKEVTSNAQDVDARWNLFRFAEQAEPVEVQTDGSLPRVPLI